MKCNVMLLVATGFVYLLAGESAMADNSRIGGIKLLPGYKHEQLQGIDSIVGKIVNPKGLSIFYEIGPIPQGPFATGGSFTDRPKKTPKTLLRWYKEQTIQGQPVHIAYLKNKTLLVSYPKSIPKNGINFSTKVESADEMADALIMLLTFPQPKVKEKK